MTTGLWLVLPNQLFDIKYLDKRYKYIIYEHPHYFKAYNYNKKKLLLHRATMQYYYDYLQSNGFDVKYVEFNDKFGYQFEAMYNPLDKLNVKSKHIFDTPNILLTSEMMNAYRNKSKKFFFNAFYMWSKKQLGVIPNIASQDKLNRQRMPDNIKISQPFSETNNTNKYIKEAIIYVNKHFQNNCGNTDAFIYPITHQDAKIWLEHFVKHKFKNFGKYQDFIHNDNPYLYHSLLSALLNIGLLCPQDVLSTIKRYEKKVPLSSYEGFVRQLFWREYQYYCYTYCNYTSNNYFGNSMKLGKEFYEGSLAIDPVDDAIKEAFDTGYLHHIKRLMVVGNCMNLAGISPREGFKWFMEFSCDSYEWVMHQNVYDMVFFVNGGTSNQSMRRPYICSSNYILKMSNYKKGNWCNKLDQLYKKFVIKHKKKLWKYRYFVNL
jgi:deoxyribodipyrimidine photolyase-related protein